MGRVFFPTYSLNRFGVRDTDQRATLGAAPSRFYQEPTPRAAMTPTRPILGAVMIANGSVGPVLPGPMPVWGGGPIRVGPIVYDPNSPPPGPAGAWIYSTSGWRLAPGWKQNPDGSIVAIGDANPLPLSLSPLVSSSGGGGSTPTPPASSGGAVSTQVGPTPTVVTPPASAAPLFVSSGGGTPAPSTPTITAPASTGFVDSVAAWLSGSTSLFNYNVPNALLAGVVVLGFAYLSSSGKKR